jgi:hypothetical protein
MPSDEQDLTSWLLAGDDSAPIVHEDGTASYAWGGWAPRTRVLPLVHPPYNSAFQLMPCRVIRSFVAELAAHGWWRVAESIQGRLHIHLYHPAALSAQARASRIGLPEYIEARAGTAIPLSDLMPYLAHAAERPITVREAGRVALFDWTTLVPRIGTTMLDLKSLADLAPAARARALGQLRGAGWQRLSGTDVMMHPDELAEQRRIQAAEALSPGDAIN